VIGDVTRSNTSDGRILARLPVREAARRIGLLPQSAQAPDGLTVADLVRFGRQPHQGLLRQWSPRDQQAVDRALAATSMTALAGRPLETPCRADSGNAPGPP
jgi:iron complex transport system ATP-binding protein